MTHSREIRLLAILALTVPVAATNAMASSYAGTCTTAPKAQWMSLDAARDVVVKDGYTVAKMKATRSGNCYEAYVVDKAGKKAELFLDPTSAKVIHAQ